MTNMRYALKSHHSSLNKGSVLGLITIKSTGYRRNLYLAVSSWSTCITSGIKGLPRRRENEQSRVLRKLFSHVTLLLISSTLSISLLLMFTLVTSSKPLLARREGGRFGRLLLAKSCLYSLILGADHARELGLGHTLFEGGYIVCIIHLERNGARSRGELTKLLLLLLLLWIIDSDVLARVDVTCF